MNASHLLSTEGGRKSTPSSRSTRREVRRSNPSCRARTIGWTAMS